MKFSGKFPKKPKNLPPSEDRRMRASPASPDRGYFGYTPPLAHLWFLGIRHKKLTPPEPLSQEKIGQNESWGPLTALESLSLAMSAVNPNSKFLYEAEL